MVSGLLKRYVFKLTYLICSEAVTENSNCSWAIITPKTAVLSSRGIHLSFFTKIPGDALLTKMLAELLSTEHTKTNRLVSSEFSLITNQQLKSWRPLLVPIISDGYNQTVASQYLILPTANWTKKIKHVELAILPGGGGISSGTEADLVICKKTAIKIARSIVECLKCFS